LAEAGAPTWAEEARQAASHNLSTLPALSDREEAWRFTRPRDLALDGKEPAPAGTAAALDADQTGGESARAARLTFVDGVPAAPDLGELPAGVTVGELGQALVDHEALVRERIYTLIGFDDRPGALNAARWEAGTFVHVARGVEVELPIEALLHATGASGRVFSRTLVVLEEGAKATVVDRYTSPDLAGPTQASSVIELFVAPGAELEHVAIVEWGAGVRHHIMLRALAERDSRVRSVLVSLGGEVIRAEPTVVLAGPGADGRAYGLYLASGEQHFEHRVVARHEGPHAHSDLLYKGAIQDHAHTIFYGNLIVRPGASGTDAYQTNRNLVLNEGAKAETIPFLEIETAEVRCSHAGSVGRVDDEHLFYLGSRGVPPEVAKRLIVTGFFQEVLEQVGFRELRDELEAAVAEKVVR
jgi:Fe-S cluster assembly protein SufD